MKVETFNIIYTITLDYIPITGTNFCAWILKKEYNSPLLPLETTEGICKISGIENKQPSEFKEINYHKDKTLILITDTLLSKFKDKGIGYIENEEWLGKTESPYTAYKNKTHTNLVVLDYSSHMYFKPDFKTPLTQCIYFDYIDANLSNEYYNIKEAFKLLSQRTDIRWTKKEILDVPYYNATERSRKYLSFFWTPTQEQYELIWEKCKSYNTTYPSTQKHTAIQDLDLLNIEQFRKPREEDY